ncbi:MAG: hypothetical protein AB7O52_07945 [Planctomycetota bacterium]
MRLSDVQIALESRSLSQCSDLAAAYLRVHWCKVYAVALLFGVPTVVGVAVLAADSRISLLWQIVAFLFVSRFAGAALVAMVGPNIFGAPLSITGGVRGFARRAPGLVGGLTLRTCLVLILLFLGLVPAFLLAASSPFVPEVVLLERLGWRRMRVRQRELIAGEYSSVLARMIGLLALGCLGVVSLFFGLDALTHLIFETGIFVGRLGDYAALGAFGVLCADEVVAITLGICTWLAYPWLRLTWFFYYLDLRIRHEGWDLELELRREVEGWEGVGA